jgi:hypothetical protein
LIYYVQKKRTLETSAKTRCALAFERGDHVMRRSRSLEDAVVRTAGALD